MSRVFTNKFENATCAKCGVRIPLGAPISWDRRAARGKRVWHLNSCWPQPDYTPTIEHNTTASEEYNSTQTNEPYEPIEDTPTMPTIEPKPTSKPKHDPLVQTIVDAIMPTLTEQFQPRQAESIDENKVAELIKKHGTTRIEIVQKEKPVTVVESAHQALPELISLLLDGESVYMYGDAGTGKTHGALQAFTSLGLEHEFISLNLQTSDTRLSGFIDANGVFRDTGFYRAYSQGKGMLIDEVDNASGNVLTALNSAIANGCASFPAGNVKRHPDFRLVTTGNTVGKGASRVYNERRQLDGAFLDRFEFIHWDYDNKLELSLGLSLNDKAEPIVKWVQQVRAFCKREYPTVLVTPRATTRILKGLNRGKALSATLDGALWHGLDVDSVNRIMASNPLPKGV